MALAFFNVTKKKDFLINVLYELCDLRWFTSFVKIQLHKTGYSTT